MTCAACGKKGPPLPPIVHIPGGVEQVEAQRQGDSVTVTVTVPAKNIDGSVPVDIGRIDVYGYTGTNAPPRARFLEVGTLIGSITVPPQNPDGAPNAAAKPGEPVPGGPARIVEVLTPDALVAKPLPPAPATNRQPPPIGPVTPPEPGPLRRFYLALPFSPRGRLGPPGMVGELRLTELPEPPLGVKASVFADVVRIEWEPSGGLIGFLLDRALAPELSPLDNPTASPASTPAPEGPTRYNVYRELAPLPTDTAPISAPAPPASPAGPINPAPLDALTFADPLTSLDGRERCYTIRSVRGQGGQAVEGHPSDPACIVPMDDAAPEPPSGLSVESAEGAIALRWVPNAEPDVAGYLILRGEAGDATLTPLTDTVVTETRYTDRTVKPGVRYVYAVQAIDTRLPRPNVSAESARVEELAR